MIVENLVMEFIGVIMPIFQLRKTLAKYCIWLPLFALVPVGFQNTIRVTCREHEWARKQAFSIPLMAISSTIVQNGSVLDADSLGMCLC